MVYCGYISGMEKIKIHAKVSQEHLSEIDKMAKDEQRSRSSMVNILLKESIDERIARVNNRIKELKSERNDSK